MTSIDIINEVESPQELSKDKKTLHSWTRWKLELDTAIKSPEAERWRKDAQRAYQRFCAKLDDSFNAPFRLNVFWSMISIFESALFPWEKMPSAAISNRYKDKDPLATAASEIYERALIFKTDDTDFEDAIKAALQDFLLGGRGQVWCRYVPTDDGLDDVKVEFLHRHDFLHNDARAWDEVTWVARKIRLTREELVAKFGKLGKDVKVVADDEEQDDEDIRDIKSKIAKGVVWEIWDKRSMQVIWIPDNWDGKVRDDGVLKIQDDPYGIKGFFPCPKPLLGTTTTDSIWPYPDYHFYKFLIEQLDILTERITNLGDTCKLKAAYDAAAKGIEELATAEEGDLVAVQGYEFADGKIANSLMFWPVAEIATVLRTCVESQRLLTTNLEEITGISDIVRGSTKASETAYAQNMKGQYATLRLRQKQGKIAAFIRDTYEVLGDIMTRNLPDECIVRMVGGDAIPDYLRPILGEALSFIKSKKDMKFRVDIETSDTSSIDQNEEKSRRSEFLHAFGQFMNMSVPMIQTFPEMAQVVGEILMFGVRGFKAGRPVEGAIESAMAAIAQKVTQMQQQPPQPPPEVMKMQMESQRDQAKLQMEGAKMQTEQQFKMQDAQLQIQLAQAKMDMKKAETDAKIQLEQAKIELERAKAESDIKMAQLKGISDISIAKQKADADLFIKGRKMSIDERNNSDN